MAQATPAWSLELPFLLPPLQDAGVGCSVGCLDSAGEAGGWQGLLEGESIGEERAESVSPLLNPPGTCPWQDPVLGSGPLGAPSALQHPHSVLRTFPGGPQGLVQDLPQEQSKGNPKFQVTQGWSKNRTPARLDHTWPR